jgi:hypothetical protein
MITVRVGVRVRVTLGLMLGLGLRLVLHLGIGLGLGLGLDLVLGLGVVCCFRANSMGRVSFIVRVQLGLLFGFGQDCWGSTVNLRITPKINVKISVRVWVSARVRQG